MPGLKTGVLPGRRTGSVKTRELVKQRVAVVPEHEPHGMGVVRRTEQSRPRLTRGEGGAYKNGRGGGLERGEAPGWQTGGGSEQEGQPWNPLPQTPATTEWGMRSLPGITHS